jgi:hypothetical protein
MSKVELVKRALKEGQLIKHIHVISIRHLAKLIEIIYSDGRITTINISPANGKPEIELVNDLEKEELLEVVSEYLGEGVITY